MSDASFNAEDSSHGPPRSQEQAHDDRLEALMQKEFTQLGISSSPRAKEQGSRRKLLLIYIHGFLGSEESFRAFPAHVHSLISVLLAETHVVHSKIYPRYKSKQYIRVARDGFSKWLQPHETPTTDIVLLGHSMGGLISAEVVLMPGSDSSEDTLLHRILGTLSFDVPYLGMHPGVVRSGLASLFSPAKEPEDKYASGPSSSAVSLNEGSMASAESVIDPDDSYFWNRQDSNFNTAFSNDVVLPVRKFWQSVAHFVHKHGRDIASATHSVVSSHVEFMSAMSNSKELRARYTKIRMLNEDSETLRKSVISSGRVPQKVRFVNYYTISSGRPKSEEQQKKDEPASITDEATCNFVEELDKQAAELKKEEEELQMLDAAPVDDLHSQSSEPHLSALDNGEPSVPDQDPGPQLERNPNADSKSSKPVRLGTFCNLPPKDSQGQRDPTWVAMFMEDVDEVGAHCGMFFVDERYERFVGDVAGRIEDWVKDDLSLRAAQAELALD